MREWFPQTLTLLGLTALGLLEAGCASQRDDSLRLSEELGRARADAAWQRARATELESRVSRLEQRTGDSARSAEDRELSSRLQRLIAQNEQLLAERGAAPAATSRVTLSPEQELRDVVERLRDRPGSPHRGLTRDQENALRVLTRPERKLDTENPWPPAFY